MIVKAYLYVSKARNVRLTKTPQTARPSEIRLTVTMDIPDRFFRRPEPVVSITVPDLLPEQSPEVLVDMTAETVAAALQVDVDEVRDGLLDAVRSRTEREATND